MLQAEKEKEAAVKAAMDRAPSDSRRETEKLAAQKARTEEMVAEKVRRSRMKARKKEEGVAPAPKVCMHLWCLPVLRCSTQLFKLDSCLCWCPDCGLSAMCIFVAIRSPARHCMLPVVFDLHAVHGLPSGQGSSGQSM